MPDRNRRMHSVSAGISQLPSTQEKVRRRPLTPWELPQLLTPLFRYKRVPRRPAKERPHLPAVLSFVYRNRFAVASQIHRRFKEQFRSDRTVRRRLAEMQDLGYLEVAPTRSTSPLWPKVFYVTGRGVKRLRRHMADKGVQWKPGVVDRAGRHKREGYSSDRVVHEILTTEFLLSVWLTIKGRGDLESLTVQRRSLSKHPAFAIEMAGNPSRLVPDALFLFRQKGGGLMACLLEMDTGAMNGKQMAMKLKRYDAWGRSNACRAF